MRKFVHFENIDWRSNPNTIWKNVQISQVFTSREFNKGRSNQARMEISTALKMAKRYYQEKIKSEDYFANRRYSSVDRMKVS